MEAAAPSEPGADALPPAEPVFVARGVYITGVNKRVSRDALLAYFGACGEIVECTFSEAPRQGFAWLRFKEQSSADRAVRELHHTSLLGTVLVVRPEMKRGPDGAPIASRDHATPCCAPRSITVVDKNYRAKNGAVAVTYSGGGLLVGNVLYPTPQGVYLVKLLQQCRSSRRSGHEAVLDFLLEPRIRHAKEITESMAMVNAVSECGSRSGVGLGLCPHVRVFVLGDGVLPFTALAMLLFLPDTWRYVCIDPLLDFDPTALGPEVADRIACLAALSQHVAVTPALGWPTSRSGQEDAAAAAAASPAGCADLGQGDAGDASAVYAAAKSASESCSTAIGRRLGSPSTPVNLVIACHSHAPLQEFWDRVPAPKYCVSLPCCGKGWSLLATEPLHVYEDFEVLSPKRRVYCYFEPGS